MQRLKELLLGVLSLSGLHLWLILPLTFPPQHSSIRLKTTSIIHNRFPIFLLTIPIGNRIIYYPIGTTKHFVSIGVHIVSELFFTNPESPPSHLLFKRRNIIVAHKERTANELVSMGVSQQIAELAVIDLRHLLYVCQRNKFTPGQTANFMYPEVYNTYTRKNGTWHFSPCSSTVQSGDL